MHVKGDVKEGFGKTWSSVCTKKNAPSGITIGAPTVNTQLLDNKIRESDVSKSNWRQYLEMSAGLSSAFLFPPPPPPSFFFPSFFTGACPLLSATAPSAAAEPEVEAAVGWEAEGACDSAWEVEEEAEVEAAAAFCCLGCFPGFTYTTRTSKVSNTSCHMFK